MMTTRRARPAAAATAATLLQAATRGRIRWRGCPRTTMPTARTSPTSCWRSLKRRDCRHETAEACAHGQAAAAYQGWHLQHKQGRICSAAMAALSSSTTSAAGVTHQDAGGHEVEVPDEERHHAPQRPRHHLPQGQRRDAVLRAGAVHLCSAWSPVAGRRMLQIRPWRECNRHWRAWVADLNAQMVLVGACGIVVIEQAAS